MDSSIGHRSRARSESSVDAPHAALLIDFDNVTMGIRSDLQNQLRKLMNSDIIKGKVSVQRAYADWRRYPQYIVPLSEASIDLIFAPAFGANKKNATDIRLAIDALELVFTRPEIGTFILLSGDSDFSALVLKLKEYGKYVIGVGIRESSSDLLIQNCDEYYSYNELTGLAKESDIQHVRRDPWQLVVEAVQRMLQENDVMRSDRLKQVMQSIDPNFDERDIGFNRFSKFVVAAAQRGLVSAAKMDNGQYAIDLGENANVSVTGQLAGTAATRESSNVKGSAGARQDGAKGTEPAPGLTLSQSFDLLKRALVNTGAMGDQSADHETIRGRMIELNGSESDPVFDSRRFVRMLRQAHDAGLIELIKNNGDGYLLKLSATDTDAEPGSGDAGAASGTGVASAKKTAKKKTAKKTKKTARRTTTRRSARSKSSDASEADEESSEADAAEPRQEEGSPKEEKTAKGRAKTARRKKASPRRTTKRVKAETANPEEQVRSAASTDAEVAVTRSDEEGSGARDGRHASARGRSSGRSPDLKSQSAATAHEAPESGYRPESHAGPSGPESKSAKRNPRYRRGSRGSVARPAAATGGTDAVAEREREASHPNGTPHNPSASAPRTSGRRSLRMRRGSRGGKLPPQPEGIGNGETCRAPTAPASQPASDGPQAAASADRQHEITSPRSLFGEAAESNEQQQGFLGKIKAALHKAVGGEPQIPDSER